MMTTRLTFAFSLLAATIITASLAVAQVNIPEPAQRELDASEAALNSGDHAAAFNHLRTATTVAPAHAFVHASVTIKALRLVTESDLRFDRSNWRIVLSLAQRAHQLLDGDSGLTREQVEELRSGNAYIGALVAGRLFLLEEAEEFLPYVGQEYLPVLSDLHENREVCRDLTDNAFNLVVAGVLAGNDTLASEWTRLGEQYRRCGFFASAILSYQSALEEDPQYRPAHEGIRLAQARDNEPGEE